jgi:inosose dehydratase
MNLPSSDEMAVKASLRLATAPVNWNNNDIPGWRPITPFPSILDRMLEAGCYATEYDAGFGTDADVLVREAATRGITWTGCYQWVDFLDSTNLDQAIRDLEPRFALLQTIECRHLIVSDSLRPNRIALAGRVPDDGSASVSDDAVAQLADGVHRLADAAASFDLAVHYHNHVGSHIEAPHEVEALIRHLDLSRVDLCFDTGHYAYGGGDAETFIREHRDSIGYLHLKDVDTDALADARAKDLSFIDALRAYVFSPIGTGSADIPAILQTLVSTGFDGWVVVEQDTCEGDPTETARQNLAFITDWLANARDAIKSGKERA